MYSNRSKGTVILVKQGLKFEKQTVASNRGGHSYFQNLLLLTNFMNKKHFFETIKSKFASYGFDTTETFLWMAIQRVEK